MNSGDITPEKSSRQSVTEGPESHNPHSTIRIPQLEHRLKDKLPHTWSALFNRFGRFTNIQTQAIEPLLAGQNCILVSATASGKTEAALAPLLERHKQQPQRGLSIIYIVPTRALTRDLARRLQSPLEQLAVRMQVKTGDEPALNVRRPPELLLTTPESFDSLLANRPRLVKDARAVLLDEIHLYDNTVRGDQLRIMLNRLRRIKRYALSRGETTSEALQFCALSATINDAAAVAARYFADPLVVHVAGQRELDAELRELVGPESLVQLFADLQRRGCKKVLAFCNRRAECEEWAYMFHHGSPFGDRVFVHHGSLDARVRHATEREFSRADAALCFATSTLELGIDIGDVDLIMLLGPPDGASAFLQRIGRGNRRTARTSVVCFYRTATEHALFRVFIRAAQSGQLIKTEWEKGGVGEWEEMPVVSHSPTSPLPHSPTLFFRPSVVIQQLCSYIKQTRLGEIDPDSAYELFTSPQGAPLIARPQYDQIIEHLILNKYFAPARGSALKPGVKWQELYERHAIYTNLLDAKRDMIDLIDEVTGRRLGQIEWGTPIQSAFLFGGQTRRATRLTGRKLVVQSLDEEPETALRFRAPWRPLTPSMARALAIELGVPHADSASHIALLRDDNHTEGSTDNQNVWLFHCAGDAYGLVLGDLLEARANVKVIDTSGLHLVLEGDVPTGPLQFSREQVQGCVRRRWQELESWFDLGRFQWELPFEVRRASVMEAFNVAEFLHTFAGRHITEVRSE